jgi:hypothetical protein
MRKIFVCVALASLLASSVSSAAPAPAPRVQRLPTWSEAGWICLSIVGEAASLGIGTPAILLAQGIGLLGISVSGGATTDPEVQPAYFLAPGPAAPGPAALQAMAHLSPPHATASGTPAQMAFTQKMNAFADLGLTLKTTSDPDTLRGILNDMAVALEDAADAYDATGLAYSLTQANIDAFQANCADGTCPAREDSALTAAGLTPAEKEAVSQYLAGANLHLAQPSVSASTLLHQGALHLRQLPLWKGFLHNAGNFLSPCTTPFAVCCSGDWGTGTASPAEITAGFGNAGAYVDGSNRLHMVFHQPTALADNTIPIPADFSVGPEFSQALGYGSVVIKGGTYLVDFSSYSEFGELTIPTVSVVGTDGRAADPAMRLGSPFPNPARALTDFAFATPRRGIYQVRVLDVAGRLVRTIYDQEFEPGEHRARWDGTDDAGRKVRGGVYFYVLRGEGNQLAKKVTML